MVHGIVILSDRLSARGWNIVFVLQQINGLQDDHCMLSDL